MPNCQTFCHVYFTNHIMTSIKKQVLKRRHKCFSSGLLVCVWLLLYLYWWSTLCLLSWTKLICFSSLIASNFLVWSQGGKSFEIFYSGGMRPIFCGNVEYNARQSELERLFRRYGRVDRVDMKSGKPRKSWFYVLFLTWYWRC